MANKDVHKTFLLDRTYKNFSHGRATAAKTFLEMFYFTYVTTCNTFAKNALENGWD